MIGSYDQLGWTGAVAIVTVVAALSLLPMLAYPERSLRRPEALVGRPGGKLGRLRALASRVALLGFYFAALNAISGLNGLPPVDLGWSLATVGFVTGGLSPFFNLVMALLAGLLLRRVGTVPLITAFAAGLILATGFMLIAMSCG